MSGNFSGVTFAAQNVTPADDAMVRRAIFPDCILTGCDFAYSGSTLTISAGSLMICGRQIRVSGAQTWAVTGGTSGYARLLLAIDLTRTATKDSFDQAVCTIEYAASSGGFPALQQDDINAAGAKYQAVLCVVALGTSGIVGIVNRLHGDILTKLLANTPLILTEGFHFGTVFPANAENGRLFFKKVGS